MSAINLEEYEKEILMRMLECRYISGAYSSIENIERRIKWKEIAKRYGVRKGFKTALISLREKGLIADHGKSLKVASLTKEGFRMAIISKKGLY